MPYPSPAQAQPLRITVKAVAKKAGVSLMTASYALRNHPKIPRVTRDRIQRVAARLGYRPDPEMSRLMHLLRKHKHASFQTTLAFLSFQETPHATHRYTADLIAGAKDRAAQLGYSVDVLSVAHSQLGRSRLTTMLKTRGIRGVLIPPLPEIVDCSAMLDWSQFSVIAATYSAQNLVVNRVVPNHQGNIMEALTRLRALGYRRPGLVLVGDLVRRANSAYQAVLALRQQNGDFAYVPAFNGEFSEMEDPDSRIRPWLLENQPDLLLTVEAAVPTLIRVLGSRYPATIGIGVLDHSGVSTHAGIDQHPSIIGEAAVELLAGQIQHGEVGLGRHPRITMIDGTWLAGTSIRPRKRAPARPR